jgi:pyruvate/2-oxoglutarate/acetoin dehydrogenase E1 component
VPDGDHVVEFGTASVLRAGTDVTLVAIGRMVKPASKAAARAVELGVDVEVIDPRTLVPLDEATLLESVGRTGRLVVVDEARQRCSAASEIASVVAERGFDALQAPIRRVTTPDVAMPYAPAAEQRMIPDEERIVAAILQSAGERPEV